MSLTLGGQGTLVQLTSSNASYNADTRIFQADVTVQNLIGQALGTAEGTVRDPDGVRVFFHSGPTVTGGFGTVTVENPSGVGTFTGSDQPYFQYDEILDPQEVSQPLTWQWFVLRSVTTFEFSVFVTAAVPHPTGWVEVTPDEARLGIGETVTLTSTLRDVTGQAAATQDLTWVSSSPSVAVAAVTPGTATGISLGAALVTVSSGGSEAPAHVIIHVPDIEALEQSIAEMEADLRALVAAEDAYYAQWGEYAFSNLEWEELGFTYHPNVTGLRPQPTADGFWAEVIHAYSGAFCRVYVGSDPGPWYYPGGPPATTPREPGCNDRPGFDMRKDLLRILALQDESFRSSGAYVTDLGVGYVPSYGVNAPNISLTSDGWGASINHNLSTHTCIIYHGSNPFTTPPWATVPPREARCSFDAF